MAPSILEDIVATRRTHLPAIAELVEGVQLEASTRSLADRLRQTGPQFIMECKAASPSHGVLCADYKPRELARTYSQFAAGISVLCEPTRFGGSYDHLATVAASTHLPVLCKDFIVDPVQVRAARHFGADAVLLMLSVLDDATYIQLAEEAASLGLDILTEAISAEEIERAVQLGAQIVGINNRNLHDLSIDLTRTEELAEMVPSDRIVISESGITSHAAVRRLGGLVDGFLVGSHLSGSEDVDVAARSLVFGDNKVCGLTSAAAAQVARANGAVYGGLIFEPSSPRYVSSQEAGEIILAEPGLQYVAVTRAVEDFPVVAGLSAIQLHAPYQGSIEAELAFAKRARHENPGLEIWRAVDMTQEGASELAEALMFHVKLLVLDTGAGGTGEAFDWAVVPDVVKPVSLLAGGIGPDNLRGALEVGCAGVDLNSGVEGRPGEKDAALVRKAFEICRENVEEKS